MEPGGGEAVEIAGMVVVQVRNDDVLDIDGLDAETFQRIDAVERQLAGPRLGSSALKPVSTRMSRPWPRTSQTK